MPRGIESYVEDLLARLTQKEPGVVAIDLDGDVKASSLRALSEKLIDYESLQALLLLRNGLCQAELMPLLRMMMALPGLAHLEIVDSEIGVAGAFMLSQPLNFLRHFRER